MIGNAIKERKHFASEDWTCLKAIRLGLKGQDGLDALIMNTMLMNIGVDDLLDHKLPIR
jgi:hypothetical protein